MRQQTVAHGEGVADDTSLRAGQRPAVPVQRGDGDGLQPPAPVRLDHGMTGHHRNAVTHESGRVPGSLGELRGSTGPGPRPTCEIRRSGRLHQGDDPGARSREAGGDGKQQGPGAGHDGRTAGQYEPALQQRLGTARGDHAGQCPAGEGQNLLVAAGRQQHPVGVDRHGLILLRTDQ